MEINRKSKNHKIMYWISKQRTAEQEIGVIDLASEEKYRKNVVSSEEARCYGSANKSSRANSSEQTECGPSICKWSIVCLRMESEDQIEEKLPETYMNWKKTSEEITR